MSRTLAAVALAIVVTAPTSLQGLEPAQDAAADKVASKETIRAVRDIGTALMSWITDDIAQGSELPSLVSPKHVSWASCEPTTHDRIEAILVPEYISEVASVDGWGNELEFCLDHNLTTPLFAGLRSAGRDGEFEGDSYKVGRFDPSAFDKDVVWLNGFFVTWPQHPPSEE